MAVIPELFFFFFNTGTGLLVGVTEFDWSFFAGDSVLAIFTVMNGTGDDAVAVNLDGLGITFEMRRDLESDAVVTKTVGDGIDIVGDGSAGQFRLTLTAAETAALTAFYIFTIRVSVDDQVATSEIGRLQVRQSPLWTYSGDPRISAKDAVRFLIGDTVYKDQLFTDPEILHALATRPSYYGAAAILCRAMASRVAREADTVDRDLRDAMSQRSRAYSAMAIQYDNQALLSGAGAMPYAGGISVADKLLQLADPDRVLPGFNIGMDVNLIPQGPAANETPL